MFDTHEKHGLNTLMSVAVRPPMDSCPTHGSSPEEGRGGDGPKQTFVFKVVVLLVKTEIQKHAEFYLQELKLLLLCQAPIRVDSPLTILLNPFTLLRL